ncbi:TetR/AcrR family transcriptional regulator [Nemorincola caseinilytica]|uniref:TetR/AcrR family transcriptional regulator n=1 Tax=Nemorincola caseinilytica TaxID=2054315 RepID=A0ABP8NA27_9BACT
MTTRDTIIAAADKYIREIGYNAFSYKDISNSVGIRTASIHYYFPAKSDLGVATIQYHMAQLEAIQQELANAAPLDRLLWFLQNYSRINAENKVCLVGALSTAFNTLDEPIQQELRLFAESVLNWITGILADGQREGTFHFGTAPRTKAMMVITNMLAIVQLARLTGAADIERVQKAIIEELTKQAI